MARRVPEGESSQDTSAQNDYTCAWYCRRLEREFLRAAGAGFGSDALYEARRVAAKASTWPERVEILEAALERLSPNYLKQARRMRPVDQTSAEQRAKYVESTERHLQRWRLPR